MTSHPDFKGILYMQNGNNWSLSSKLKSKKVLGLIPGWDLPVSSLHVPSVCVVSRWCDGFPSYLTILRGDAHISSCIQLQELYPNLWTALHIVLTLHLKVTNLSSLKHLFSSVGTRTSKLPCCHQHQCRPCYNMMTKLTIFQPELGLGNWLDAGWMEDSWPGWHILDAGRPRCKLKARFEVSLYILSVRLVEWRLLWRWLVSCRLADWAAGWRLGGWMLAGKNTM